MKETIVKGILAGIPRGLVVPLIGDFIPVFMLHRLVDDNYEPHTCQIKRLHQYLEYIRKKKYNPISLDELFLLIKNNKKIPDKAVVFTIDDGFYDQFDITAPIFTKYDIPLTCFVITDFLDGKLWPWDDQIRYIFESTKKTSLNIVLPNGANFDCDYSKITAAVFRQNFVTSLKIMNQTEIYNWLDSLYLQAEVDKPTKAPEQYRSGSWQQAVDFSKQGHSVAAHSKTHRIVSQLNDADAYDEIVGSYEYLKDKVPDCSNVFAYPSGKKGEFCKRDESIVDNSVMFGAVSAIPSSVTKTSNIAALPRYSLPDKMSDFLQYLSYIEAVKNKIRKIN